MLILIIVLSALVLFLAYLSREHIKDAFGILWMFTGGPWISLFKESSSFSTGNGAGMFGGLFDLLMIAIHICFIIGFIVGLIIWWFVK